MVGHPVQWCVVALRTQRAALVENHGTHRCHAPPRPGGPRKFFLPEVGTIQILYHCDFYLEKNDTCHFCPTQVTCFTLTWTNISHRCIMGKSRVLSPIFPTFHGTSSTQGLSVRPWWKLWLQANESQNNVSTIYSIYVKLKKRHKKKKEYLQWFEVRGFDWKGVHGNF